MDHTQLAIYGWLQLEDAARDMPFAAPADLFERFIGWTSTRSFRPHELP
jgi:hypothetical protein